MLSGWFSYSDYDVAKDVMQDISDADIIDRFARYLPIQKQLLFMSFADFV
jgi:hypothetical protein